jgi:hypothetical protein
MRVPTARSAWTSTLTALLLAGAGAVQGAVWRVEPLGCDSLGVDGSAPGWSWLEADHGQGFTTVGTVAAWTAPLRLAAPAPGGSLALRAARLDSLGLPEYDDEWIWQRALPRVEAELQGRHLSGRLRGEGPDCPLPDLVLRLEQDGRLVELRRVPVAASFRVELPERTWSSLSLAWAGQGALLRLDAPVTHRQESAAQAAALDSVPAAPLWLGFDGEAPRLSSVWPLEILAGDGRLEQRPDGSWSLRPAGQGEVLVAARDAAGRHSLPFRWEAEGAAALARALREGPGGMRVTPLVEGTRDLVWLDGSGAQGRLPLTADGVLLEGLSNWCLLQVLEEGRPAWSQRVELAWPAPDGLRLAGSSDTLLEARLEDSRGWSEVWELEWRHQGGRGLLPAAALHRLTLPERGSLHLRWRAGRAPSRSRWSPWREIPLDPATPAELRAAPHPGGVRLDWAVDPWLTDRLELERAGEGDTLRVVVDARTGHWLDSAPPGRVWCYRVRPRLVHRLGEWSAPLWMATPGRSAGLAPRRLSVAEWRPFARESGTPMPVDPEWVEGRGGLPRDDAPLRGVSPREALAYCNWINARLGLGGRYDEAGVWSPGAGGGLRLPRPGEGAGLGRIWVLDAAGFRAEGESALRSGSARRLYHVDARQPDVGLALVVDTPAR